jgi:hypothetical protein
VEVFPEEWANESSLVLDEGTIAGDDSMEMTSLESPSQVWEEDYTNIDAKMHLNFLLQIGETEKTIKINQLIDY